MKITLLVSGSIRSNFSYRALGLARSLRKLGHEVSIISPAADKYNNFSSESINSIDGVRILQPFQFKTRYLEINLTPYLFDAIRLLFNEKPDLVYIYKPTPISIIGLLLKLFKNTEVVADFDDLGSEVMKIEGHPTHQQKLVRWSEQLAAKYADRIVTASSYLFQIYREEFPHKPIHVMPNAVEADWLVPVVFTPNSKRIVFMGSINRKNILKPLFQVLPDIFKKHPDVSVVIIGDGKFIAFFKDLTRRLGISKQIDFTGWLSLEDAKKELIAGDIGYNFMPDERTTNAASNMKVSQYMARGVVPLVSDVGDLPATVNFGKAGYIAKAGNIDSLRTTLLEALEDTGRLDKSKEARNFTCEKLNWDTQAKAFGEWINPQKTKKPKVYLVATNVPGDVGGGEVRNYNLIRQLIKEADAEVEVFCIAANNPIKEKGSFELEIAAKCHPVPKHGSSILLSLISIAIKRVPPFMEEFRMSGLGQVVRTACEQSLPDIIQIEQLSAYYCIRPHIAWLRSKGVKIIFDCHNIEYQAFADSLEIFPKPIRWIGKMLTPHLKKLELEAAEKSTAVFACSDSNAEFFSIYNPDTYLIPNGVEVSDYLMSPSENTQPTVLFMGGVAYPPNADALTFYLTEIHPKVKAQIPNVKFLAIGCDKAWLDAMNIDDPSIKPLGFVKDIRPYLAQATLGVCPIRYGSGTRIKIMTYMAGMLPVVSTYKGAEGVGYTNGLNISLVDDSRGFAEKVIDLLKNPTQREILAKNGHDFIYSQYDWSIIGKRLSSTYQKVLQLIKPYSGYVRKKSNLPYLLRPLSLYFLGGLVIVNYVALFSFNPFFIGSFLSFIYIFITPGLLFLPLLSKKTFSAPLGIALSIALSAVLLMLVGLAVNTALPLLGIREPLSTGSMLIVFDVLVYILLLLNYEYKENSPFEFHTPDRLDLVFIGLAFLLPIISSIGAILLNNGDSDFLTLITLGSIAVLTGIVAFTKRHISPLLPPLVLYMSALALLLMNSLRGWYITGHDILLEYHVFILTNTAHLWNMAFYQDPYMACLSLTILPTFLESLIHVDPAYIFKFFTQFLGALPVVMVYYLTKEYTSEKISFLAGFLYISFPTFMVDMAFLNRQGIAFLFFGALLFVLFSKEYFSGRMRTFTLFAFGLGIILSHYSTSYITTALLIATYFFSALIRLAVTAKRPRWIAQLTGRLGNREVFDQPVLLTLPFVIGFAILMFTWSTLITQTSTSLIQTVSQIVTTIEQPFNLGKEQTGPAQYSLVVSSQPTPQTLYNQFVKQSLQDTHPTATSTVFFSPAITSQYPTTPVPEELIPITQIGSFIQAIPHINLTSFYNDVKQGYARVLQLLLLFGLVGMGIGYSFRKNVIHNVPVEYLGLSIAGIVVMVGQTVLPASAIDYGLLRLFQQNLLFLSLPIILAFVAVISLFNRSHRIQIIISGTILLLFYLILSGFIPQFTGAARAPLALDNYGLYYDSYYMHAQEVYAMQWTTKYADSEIPIQAAHFSDIKMVAYGHIEPRIELLPQTTRKDSYVYLNYENATTGNIIEVVNGDILYYHFPIAFLNNYKNLIYNNGGSEIYR